MWQNPKKQKLRLNFMSPTLFYFSIIYYYDYLFSFNHSNVSSLMIFVITRFEYEKYHCNVKHHRFDERPGDVRKNEVDVSDEAHDSLSDLTLNTRNIIH